MPIELRTLQADMAAQVRTRLKGFVSQDDDSALMGPSAPMPRFPQFGGPVWALIRAPIGHDALPRRVRQVAVLAVRAAFGSRYKLYAHERGAEQVGLDPATIATLAVGQRPVTLSDEEQASFGIASVLATGRHLPQSTYRWALELSGEQQVAELVYLVGGYSLVSVLLNAFDVPVPERDDA